MRSNEPGAPVAGSPVVFVFFDAWTLVTGRHIGMVRRILEQGFSLLDFEFRTLSEADAEEIYRTNHPIREGNSWHVARLVYPMGRSLGLLFGLNDADSCACARMQRLKGKANPSLNKAGQLRYDFLAPNRCLSLMHSSDGLEQVRREGAVFFEADRIDAACVAARGVGGRDTRGLMTDLVEAGAESGMERVEEPGLAALFARIRLRLVAELRRMSVRGRPAGLSSWHTPLLAYKKLWEPLDRESSRAPVMDEAKSYLQVLAREGPVLQAVVDAVQGGAGERVSYAEYYRPSVHEPLSLVRCLQVLNNPEAYSQWDSDRQLPRAFLYDRWEWLLFRTHLFNFDDLLPARPEAS
jgi:nucleoside diphosphate kinase